MEQPDQLSTLIIERAVWSVLWRIEGALDSTLVEIFRPDYAQLVADAAARLELTLGDFGIALDARSSADSRAETSEDSPQVRCTAARYSNRADDQCRTVALSDPARAGMSESALPVTQDRI